MEHGNRVNQMLDKLKESGCRLTPQRLAVMRILAVTTKHPSVEQIYEQLQVDFPATSLATVYKTVTLLKGLGEVMELGFGSGRNHYDGRDPSPHPHLVCTSCEKIVDAESDAMVHIAKELEESSGFLIKSHRLDFFGLCPQCRAGQA